MGEPRSYRRAGWSLPLVPGPDGRLPAERSRPVEDTLRLVLDVVPGERRLLPEFGCRIHFLGALEDARSLALAASLVEEAIERWAPDLGADRVEVAPLDGPGAEVSVRAGGTWHRVRIPLRTPRDASEAAEVSGLP